MAEPRVLVIVLAGGKGKRLLPLTNDRAKPAVPFGGSYRPSTSCCRTRQRRPAQDGRAHAVQEPQPRPHISQTWRFSTLLGQYVTPVRRRCGGPFWFSGSADAIYQNLDLIYDENPDLVCVFGADHIYRMDPRQLIDHHREVGAGVTVAAIPVRAGRPRLRGDRVRRRRPDHRVPREGAGSADDAGDDTRCLALDGQLRVRHPDPDRRRTPRSRRTPTSAVT